MQFKNRFLIGALLFCFVECIFNSASAAPLLVISIDGMQPNYVTHADQYHLKIPVLRSFMKDGTYASGVIAVFPSLTFPGHTTIMTGVSPAEHGITSNETFDPLNINEDGWYWYASDIKVPTLWSAAAHAKLITASGGWPVTIGDSNIKYLLPEYWRASTTDDLKLIRPLARPIGLLETYEKELGPYIDGDTTTIAGDLIRTKFAVKLLADKHPDFMAVHLIALDEIEHEDGPFQTTAFATLEALDAMIGDLRKAALAANPQTVIAVVSDHGFSATHSMVNLRVAFVAAGLITMQSPNPTKLPGVASWKAEVWTIGGAAAIMLHDHKDVKTRQQVAALLKKLQADPKNGIERILSPAEARALGGFPDADWVVECAPGFFFGPLFSGALVMPTTIKGMHGYSPKKEEMHASFFMEGAGVSKHALGVIDMRQLAPTFAKILGIKLPSAKQPTVNYE